MQKSELQTLLIVGTKVKIGKEYADKFGRFDEGEIIEFMEGYFECDNGLYTETKNTPSIWDGGEFDSIYHLFGNNLENFLDCEIIIP